MPGRWARLTERIFAPIDLASLVVYRVAFGTLLAWEAYRYLSKGWVARKFADPDIHFPYFGFDWLPRPGEWATPVFLVLGVLGVCVAVGFCYRVAAALFFLGFSWMFLQEQAYYLNHLYLVCLLAFLVPFLPAHRAFSIDAWREPSLRADRVSGWSLFLLRAMFVLVYTFAGIAKINPDWLRAQPLLGWLEARRHYPLVGPLLEHDTTAWVMSYGGLAFDLLVGPALCWSRTRPFALVAAFCFHATNALLFDIGIFPWLMMASTLLFLPPSWPRTLGLFPATTPVTAPLPAGRARALLMAALAAWLGLHTALPLRHWLYPGDVAWTEEGHLFAWRMKLRTKEGRARFRVVDVDTGEARIVNPARRLPRLIAKQLPTHPDMILQYAHHLAERAAAQGRRVAVYADVRVSLNGRRPQRYVDPTVDLAAEAWTWTPASWILPQSEPLPGWDW